MKVKICMRCQKEIVKKDKAVSLKTFIEGVKDLEEVFFHYSCYLEWLNENIGKKAEGMFRQAIGVTQKVVRGLIQPQ